MRVDIFDYDLPVEKIATSPVRPRDASRLLDLTGGKIADKSIRDLPGIFQPNDLLHLYVQLQMCFLEVYTN